MFDAFDHAFFTRRAEEERERAANAKDISASRTHAALALEYERKAQSLSMRARPPDIRAEKRLPLDRKANINM